MADSFHVLLLHCHKPQYALVNRAHAWGAFRLRQMTLTCLTATFAVSPDQAPEVRTINYNPRRLLAQQTARAWQALSAKFNIAPTQ